jgi:two-component system, OmpR family, KDP operon response regulator KdpE
VAKLLAIDDEVQILTALARGFQRAGHEVVVARTGTDGLAAAATASPDVVLVDLRLPDLDGIEVVRRMRAWTPVPILLLSGAGTERAKVEALDAGADDFVDKPFSMEELRARVDAALRRAHRAGGPADAVASVNGSGPHHPSRRADGVLVLDGITIDLPARAVSVDGAPVRLTPTEWRLLEVLLAHPGRVLTYGRIISEVWSPQHGDEARSSLRAHLRTLRRKLGDDAADPRFITTEPGVGYRWRPVTES